MFAASKIIEKIWKCLAINMLAFLLLIVKCLCNKIKFLCWATSALEKSFQLIYSNIHLSSRETAPLTIDSFYHFTDLKEVDPVIIKH